jgi:hypothetical protein
MVYVIHTQQFDTPYLEKDNMPYLYDNIFVFAISCIFLSFNNCDSFELAPSSSLLFPVQRFSRVVTLHETKRESSKGKGFGKKEVSPTASSTRVEDDDKIQTVPDQPANVASTLLQNVAVSAGEKEKNLDSSPEERAKQILRDKYGMKTLEEQQLDAVQLARRKEEQKKWSELKKKAEAGDDFDLFAILPVPVTIGIDRFLKAGTLLCGIIFVASGVLIAVEAWSKAFGDPLPPDLDDFIVHTIEPNFTPGLLVLLSFSVSLGLFASLQLGSQGASYKEK